MRREGPAGRAVIVRRMSRTPLRIALLAAALPLTFVACGGDDTEGATTSTTGGAGGGASSLPVEAFDSFEFDAEQYTAEAGEITFRYVNEGSLPHTLVVDDHESDMRLKVAKKGDADEGSITLDPGDYTIYCDVAGHRAGGMEAELTVE